MQEVQFSAVVLLSLISMALLMLLPRHVTRDAVLNRSRWYLFAGLELLALQFMLQFVLGLRQMGVMQAAMLNLVLFIPCSALFSLSVLNLQRQGRLSRLERLAVVPTWLTAVALLVCAEWTNDLPLLAGSERVLWAEIAASAVYAVMQIYYSVLTIREVTRMQLSLDNYYDRERGGLLDWMRLSIGVLTLMALSVPVLIFTSGWPLAVFTLLFFVGIFYVWFCFVRYVISNASLRMREADREEQRTKDEEQRTKDEEDADAEVKETSTGTALPENCREISSVEKLLLE